jgi:chitin synthase
MYTLVSNYPTLTAIHPRPLDPDMLGDPYGRPISIASSGSNGVDTAWRRRQTIRRGVKKEVKLTNGNFITEYPVPTPVYSAVEAKWTSGVKTKEFS